MTSSLELIGKSDEIFKKRYKPMQSFFCKLIPIL